MSAAATAAAAANANAATPDAPPPKKSSKRRKLLIFAGGVLLLALLGAAGALYILKKNTADAHDDGDGTAIAEQSARPRTPPTFLPLENMVINLADPGGNRFIQLGLTLQLQDGKTADAMKAYLPSIRSQILVLISQRSSEEMLGIEGKERLARDIVEMISREMGYATPKPGTRDGEPNPVQAVRFSSFIVQ